MRKKSKREDGRKERRGEGEKEQDRDEGRERCVVLGILGSAKGLFTTHCGGSRAWGWRGIRSLSNYGSDALGSRATGPASYLHI